MALSLRTVKGAKFSTSDELVEAVGKDAGVLSMMRHQYAALDVEKVFSRLLLCKEALQAAKAASGNHACSVHVLKTLTGYQDVVHKSTLASGSFVNACLGAMRIHKMTCSFLEKNMYQKALDYFGKLHGVAKQMAVVAEEVEQDASRLLDTCTMALTQAQTDATVSEVEKKKIRDMLHFSAGQKAKCEAGVRMLREQIAEAKEEEDKIAAQAKAEKDRAFALQMTASIIGGIGKALNPLAGLASSLPTHGTKRARSSTQCAVDNPTLAKYRKKQVKAKRDIATKKEQMKAARNPEDVQRLTNEIGELEAGMNEVKQALTQASSLATKHAEHLEEMEPKQKKMRQDLQASQREQTQELAKTVEDMKHMSVQSDNVEQAMKSLSLCVVTLGKIRTTFADVKMFWEQVANHCKKLAQAAGSDGPVPAIIETMVDDPEVKDAFMEEFAEELVDSARSWAALGLQANNAFSAMRQAKDGVDEVMNDLPVGDCTHLLQGMLTKLDEDVQHELALHDQ